MSEYNNIPKIRFKGFTDAWEQRKFEDELQTVTDYVAAGSFADLAENVKYLNFPNYAQLVRTMDLKNNFTSKEQIFVDKKAFDFLWRVNLNKESIILPNIGNCGEIYLINKEKLRYKNNVLGPNAILVRSITNNNKFLSYSFQTKRFQDSLKLIISPNGQTKFNKTDLKTIEIIIPKTMEQVKIGNLLNNIDNLITLHQRKCDKLINIKKSMLEKMFPKNSSNIPEIRFKGFTDVWEQRKVTDIGKLSIGLVTTMTSHYTDKGTLLIRNSDIKANHFEFDDDPIYLDKEFADKNSNRKHQIGDVITVHTGDVGTSAVIDENTDKSIGFATIITRPNLNIIDSYYLSTFLNTEKHKKWAVAISTGDGRTNYNLGDYQKLIVPLTLLDEQKKISKFISNIDNLITLHQRKVEKLNNIKKSMLEKMFV